MRRSGGFPEAADIRTGIDITAAARSAAVFRHRPGGVFRAFVVMIAARFGIVHRVSPFSLTTVSRRLSVPFNMTIGGGICILDRESGRY
jgi:hypothetical protein